MRLVSATASIFIDAPKEKVWEVLADDFAGIGKWASNVSHSQGFGPQIGGSPYNIRACEITAAGFDDTKEEILEYNADDFVLKYELSDGLPGFVKDALNTWTLEEQNGGTLLSGHTTMQATGVMGFMMNGLMKGATRKALENMCRELKYYVETGEPHPDKVAATEKEAKQHKKMRDKVISFTVSQEIAAPVDRVWQVIGEDFADVSNSHPKSPKSEWLLDYSEPQVGARRIMYMSANEKKYFIDKIAEWDPENYHLTIEVVDKKGYPINVEHTWVNMDAESLDANRTRLQIRFNYLTKPTFLKRLAKANLKKQFQEYIQAIDYHVMTGEIVTNENWKQIRKNYQAK